jgi:ATP-dependent DNA ligase
MSACAKLRTDMCRNARARKPLPVIAAHQLELRHVPFDDPDWLFELKADGFHGLLYIAQGTGRLVSRNGRELRRFRPLAENLARKLKVQCAISTARWSSKIKQAETSSWT